MSPLTRTINKPGKMQDQSNEMIKKTFLNLRFDLPLIKFTTALGTDDAVMSFLQMNRIQFTIFLSKFGDMENGLVFHRRNLIMAFFEINTNRLPMR